MITANSRLLLLNYLLACPPEKLIYCDTDSLYCFDHELPVGDNIGEMKLEKKAKLFIAYQPKAYRMDDFYRAKGVPRPKYRDDGTIEIDYARQYVEAGYTEFERPIRFRASLNSKRGGPNKWVTQSKGMRSGYAHKQLTNGRYYPPVIGLPNQTELFKLGEVESKRKRITKTNKQTTPSK
jgi:hypothetical protein